MHNDLSDIARGRRISAVTARELDLITHHARPAPPLRDRPGARIPALRALRALLLRLARRIG